MNLNIVKYEFFMKNNPPVILYDEEKEKSIDEISKILPSIFLDSNINVFSTIFNNKKTYTILRPSEINFINVTSENITDILNKDLDNEVKKDEIIEDNIIADLSA